MRRLGGVAWVTAACALLSSPVLAEDLLPDTRALHRHAMRVLPDFILPNDMISALPPFWHRHGAVALPDLGAGLDPAASLRASAGVTAGSTLWGATQGMQRGTWGQGMLALRTDRSFGYADGNGGRIEQGYQHDMAQGLIRLAPQGSGGSEVSLYGFEDDWTEARLPNYGMDASDLTRRGLQAGLGGALPDGFFSAWKAKLGWNRLEYDLDNYTYRPLGPILLQVQAQFDQFGGEVALWRGTDASRTELHMDVGLDVADSRSYNHEAGQGSVGAIRWPGVQAAKAGLGLGHRFAWEGGTRLGVSGRLDYFRSTMNDAALRPGVTTAPYNFSPLDLYRTYYGGAVDTDMENLNLSGKVRLDQDLAWPGSTGFVQMARLVRNPDIIERAIAQTGPIAIREVGNPTLSPEAHHSLTTGLDVVRGGHAGFGRSSPVGAWRLSAQAGFDRVTDFITADHAHGQAAILANDGAHIYRNVEAWISRQDADLQMEVLDGVGLRLNLTAARGRNISDGRPLYQIAPLEANVLADWHGGDADWGWNSGFRLRMVAAKKTVDGDQATGAGYDKGGPAGAFGTLDLYAGLRVSSAAAVTVGVENVFDKLYREHLQGVPNTAFSQVLNAPGRSVFLRLSLAL